MIPIIEMSLISATNTDVLSVGRLNAIPYGGRITFDFLADLGTDAANFALTLQLPNGDVPIDGQRVPASGSGLDMVLDERELFRVSYRATQGGHFVVSLTETGTAVCAFRVSLSSR